MDAKDAGNSATMAAELEAAKQREALAWNHSADLVEVITKLNDALRAEKEGREATEQKELAAWNHSAELVEVITRERGYAEASARRAAEENAALQSQVQAQ